MRRLFLLAIVATAALAVSLAASASAPAKGGSGSFTNYSLAETTGTTCPGASACSNIAAEPAIRADGAGRFFGTSENSLGEGTVAFRSTDNGLHYSTLISPDSVSKANDTGFAPGGGDTDLAVAPAKNPAGFYNVYVASLTLGNVDVSTSRDGVSKVCISYHDAPQGITVGCSPDAGTAFTQFSSAIDPLHAYQIANNAIG